VTTLTEDVDNMSLVDLLVVDGRLRRLSERIYPTDKTVDDLRQQVAKIISRKIKEHVKTPADLDTLLRALLRP